MLTPQLMLAFVGWDDLYPYTADLLTLDFCRPPDIGILNELAVVSTPLDADAWAVALADHPDKAYVSFIARGLREGFRVGFQWGAPLRSATANMPSSLLQPDVIEEYISKELSRGRMIGPLPLTWKSSIHVNRVGLVPKGHVPGKFRLITDLSFPHGASVNDGISSELVSLSYIAVDDVAAIVQVLGRGSLLAKMDIESAYRLVPVHPQDRVLQGIEWDGKVFVDPCLPFGLRSAPKIFNAVADGLCWCLRQAGIRFVLHYLDDYIIVAPPDSDECARSVKIAERTCAKLGVPLAPGKSVGPVTSLVFLGIRVDTVAGELRLPEGKLERLKSLLLQWQVKKSCRRRELESLIGLLNHACKVVRSGRSFLRRLLDLLHQTDHRPEGQGWIRLSNACRGDIAWWKEFVQSWNGVSFLQPPRSLPVVECTTDASGLWGCGAWHGTSWFQVAWDYRANELSIAGKELVPIILACAAWGMAWQACRVRCRCDNQVVVAALTSRSSKDQGVMHLLRCLVFVEARIGCHLFGEYIETYNNDLADDLSRNNLVSFLSKVPSADKQPTPISLQLLDLLLNPQADWVSERWRSQFSTIFSKGWPHLPAGPTRQQ